MTVDLSGVLLDDTGVAVSGATVELYDVDTTTPVRATDTTDANGQWDFNHATAGRFDVKITNGTDIIWLRARDKYQVSKTTVINPTANEYAAEFTRTEDAASIEVALFEGNRATPAANDEIYNSYKLSDSAGNQDEFARITVIATDETSTTEDGDIEFETIVAGTLATAMKIGSSGITGSVVLDEDNMASDSATHVATQQSIKAYVDSQIGSSNELSEVLGNGNTTGGTNIVVSAADDVTFTDTSSAIFGTGSDATINYDGTNLVINPDAVGVGDLSVGSSVIIDAGESLKFGAVDVLVDNPSGTMTLSNIDALDATTEATIEAAIDTLANLTAASSLATVGTITSGTWQGTGVGVAYGGTGASSFTDAGVLIGNGTGAVQVTTAGTSGQVLTSNGAGVDPTFQDAGGGGITDATTFRLSADTAATGDLTSNWEVDDTAGYGTLGTAVTEASGIFTFPSTGHWLIIFHAAHNNAAFSPMTVTSRIYTTDDGSSYDIRAEAINNHNNTVNSQSDTMSAILDVTSTSTHKAKVYMSRSAGSTNAAGSTSQNECHVEFIKLGDT
jgi:hypothetical protein